MLNGRKSYIVAALGVLFAAWSYWHGTMDFNSAASLVLGSAGLGALRHGVGR